MASSFIRINKLVLYGHRKNYEIPFEEGVNIIFGDSDTGKSTILEFINYFLGHSALDLAEEIVNSVHAAVLEVNINSTTYTIKRDIYKPNTFIDVYTCKIENCKTHIPKTYNPTFSQNSAKDGFYSDFLFESLNYPKVQIKVAPTKTDSNMKRLGFRTLFKYCYINQDDVGSKGLLDGDNHFKNITNREAFKYIFNVLDSSILKLEAEISIKDKKRRDLLNKYSIVSDFFDRAKYKKLDSIEEIIQENKDNITALKSELEATNSKMTANSATYSEIKDIYGELTLSEKGLSYKIKNIEDNLNKFIRLKNDYENDIEKIEALSQSVKVFHDTTEPKASCPFCDSDIVIDNETSPFIIDKTLLIENEIKTLKSRVSDLLKTIETFQEDRRSFIKKRNENVDKISDVRIMLDDESEKMITPYLTQRDSLINEISKLKQINNELQEKLLLRNEEMALLNKSSQLKIDIEHLQERLNDLKEDAPQLDTILEELSEVFIKYLKKIKISNISDVFVSERTFLPVIRNKEYSKITSGGLRTILSLGYLISLLEHSLSNNSNHPKLLMIDTVGKYLGKTTKGKYLNQTSAAEDSKEGVSDPLKYKNIYAEIFRLSVKAKKMEQPCQIILVDNDVPSDIASEYKQFIRAHYSLDGEDDTTIGLIDDINLINKR